MRKTILTLAMLAGTLATIQASIIESDNFDYNDGPVDQPSAAVINPDSTWFRNTGTTPVDVTNKTLIITTSRSEDMEHTLVGFPYETNGTVAALYSSYTLSCQGLPTVNGTYFSHFSGTNGFLNGDPNISGFRARVFASLTNVTTGLGAGPGQFIIAIVNSGVNSDNVSLGNTNYCWPTPLNTNVTYTIVTRYVLATGASTLWVNPTSESDPGVTDPNALPAEPPTAAPTNGVLAIDSYGFRQASGEGTLLIDNLKIGTSFSDVAGANQSPTISSVQTQSIPANANTGPVPFIVQDPETVASSLTVTASSSNPALVPNGSPNIVLGSDAGGTNRTVTITPTANQQGSAVITLNVSDSVNTSSTTFTVIVGAPSIGSISNVQVYSNTPVPAIDFAVSDPENDSLTFTTSSSNPGLVTPGDIAVSSSGSSGNLTITPEPDQIGNSFITVSVSDGHNTNSTSFVLTVSPKLGVVYDENFAYDDFSSGIPNALYGAAGGSGGPWSHVSGTLYQLQVTNVNATSGYAYIVGTNSEDLGADFIGYTAYDGNQGVVFYTSFTVNCTFLPSSSGEYFFHLAASGSDSSSFHDKVFANRANAADGMFRLGVANVSPEVQFPQDLSPGVAHTVVTRFNSGTGESTLWVDPINEQSPSVIATDSPGVNTVGGVALRESSGTGDLTIGPIKVGTQFSDVFTSTARPTLSYAISGGNIILTWGDSSFVLQSAPAVNGPYTDTALTSPATIPISGNQFFRLKH